MRNAVWCDRNSPRARGAREALPFCSSECLCMAEKRSLKSSNSMVFNTRSDQAGAKCARSQMHISTGGIMLGRQHGGEKEPGHRRAHIWLAGLLVLAMSPAAPAQTAAASVSNSPAGQSPTNLITAEDMNRRLQELLLLATSPEAGSAPSLQDYRIGANDLLAIKVFEAPELSLPVRVSAGGEITLPLIGVVVAGNLTPRELELVLQELLRRDFIKDPHVSVHVTEMESHAVSVMGAVKQPGVVQIRGSRSLLEVLALAGGLAPDAGSTVHVVRKPRPGSSQTAG